MTEINKAFEVMSASTAENNSAVYRINDNHSVIVADGRFTITSDNGDIIDSIAISHFARNPRTGFSKIKKAIE